MGERPLGFSLHEALFEGRSKICEDWVSLW